MFSTYHLVFCLGNTLNLPFNGLLFDKHMYFSRMLKGSVSSRAGFVAMVLRMVWAIVNWQRCLMVEALKAVVAHSTGGFNKVEP